jgi:hypothetical protein
MHLGVFHGVHDLAFELAQTSDLIAQVRRRLVNKFIARSGALRAIIVIVVVIIVIVVVVIVTLFRPVFGSWFTGHRSTFLDELEIVYCKIRSTCLFHSLLM